jgi:hypothetical protein
VTKVAISDMVMAEEAPTPDTRVTKVAISDVVMAEEAPTPLPV